MNHATKFMIVPYVRPVPNPQEAKIIALDEEMSAIVNNKKLDIEEKVALYKDTLCRFLQLYHNLEPSQTIVTSSKEPDTPRKRKRKIIKHEKVESAEPEINEDTFEDASESPPSMNIKLKKSIKATAKAKQESIKAREEIVNAHENGLEEKWEKNHSLYK